MLNSQYGSISVAVNGKWGSGKNFFIKQCKLVLDCLNYDSYSNKTSEIIEAVSPVNLKNLSEISYKTVYFDALKKGSYIGPIVSLSKNIATTTFNIKTKSKSTAFKAGKQLVRIAVEKIAKIDISGILDIFQTKEKFKLTLRKK